MNTKERLLGRTVLVVDDCPDTRAVLCEALGDAGCTPLQAGNGVEALKLLMEGARPSAIFVDLDMPLMDGRLFCEACDAADAFCRIPRIILTGNPHAAFFMSRARLVLPKPIDLGEVLATLEMVCAALPRAA